MKMMRERRETPKSLAKFQGCPNLIRAYAVQCGKCFKWRSIPSQEEYENIRSNFVDDPWFCDKKPNVSCEDPADLEYDTTRTWAIDKPNIPNTPVGFKRVLTVRRDFSKMDAYYILPTGKRVKAPSEVEKFLEENPQYKNDGVDISDFSFTVPKIMEDTVPRNVEGKKSVSRGKKIKTSTADNDD